MKKFLVFVLMMVFSLPSWAFVVDNMKSGGIEKEVREIGFKILNANKIPYKMTFYINDKAKYPNACAYYRDNMVMVNFATFKYIDSHDELAGIIAHEISHGIDYRQGAFKGYFSALNFMPKKKEIKADLRAVDFMVKAGYNPVSYIIASNKIMTQQRYDWHLAHPLPSKRMMMVYEYIYTKYPEYLVDNKYKDDIYYQNFLLTSKENRLKFKEKIQSNSNKKIKYQ